MLLVGQAEQHFAGMICTGIHEAKNLRLYCGHEVCFVTSQPWSRFLLSRSGSFFSRPFLSAVV